MNASSLQEMPAARAPLEQLRGYLYSADKLDRDFILHRLADLSEALDARAISDAHVDMDEAAQRQMEFGH